MAVRHDLSYGELFAVFILDSCKWHSFEDLIKQLSSGNATDLSSANHQMLTSSILLFILNNGTALIAYS